MSGDSSLFDTGFPQKLPHYTYVPGVTPHPVSDVRGHAYSLSRPTASGEMSWGRELFNQGFYWEAHEAWEAEWLADGKSGPRANLIKGFIKLAACGVKCLETNGTGASRHARRAAELFQENDEADALNSLTITLSERNELIAFALKLADAPPLASSVQKHAATHGGVPLLGPLPTRRT